MSVGEYISQPVNGEGGEIHSQRFFDTETSNPKSKRAYVNRLKEMTWFYTPSDVKDPSVAMTFNKERFNAASRFFEYVKRNLSDDESQKFNGYDLETFKTSIKAASKEYEENYKEDVGDVTYNPTPEEIREVVGYVGGGIPDKSIAARVQIMMYISAYCGARLEQLWRYLKETPPKERRFEFFPKNSKEKTFFRIDVSNIGEGHKNVMYYYLPIELISAMRTMTVETSHDHIGKAVARAGRDNVRVIPELDEFDCPTGRESIEKRPITFKTMRKYNMLQLVLSGVDSQVANAIQGRIATGVDAKHYIKYGDETAVQQYPKFLELMKNKLPVPDWMVDYQNGDETPDAVKRESAPAPPSSSKFAAKTDTEKKQIIRTYNETKSLRKTAEILGVSRNTVSNIIKENKGL